MYEHIKNMWVDLHTCIYVRVHKGSLGRHSLITMHVDPLGWRALSYHPLTEPGDTWRVMGLSTVAASMITNSMVPVTERDMLSYTSKVSQHDDGRYSGLYVSYPSWAYTPTSDGGGLWKAGLGDSISKILSPATSSH